MRTGSPHTTRRWLRTKWLARATDYSLGEIEDFGEDRGAMELAFAVRFLDAASDRDSRAQPLLERLGERIPADGVMAVTGGIEGEAMRPLDFAPYPDRPARELFSAEVLRADLERLADGQREDGGWEVDFRSYSPAGAFEWRGHATVRAVTILKRDGLL